MTNAIEIKNLTKTYSGFKLDNVTFNLPKGSIMGLVGENGAGKSTTINLIMNAIDSDSGTVKVFGVDNRSGEFVNIKEDIGVVLDEAYFPEIITPKIVNVIMKNTYKSWNEEQFFGYIKRFDLPVNKQFKDFSRGMRMKLAIAVALSHNAKLLILDEPTGGLDPFVRDEILDILNEFTRDEEHSILISSHIVSDLEKICDYIAFIHKGRLQLNEEKDVLLEKYSIIKMSREDFENVPDEAVIGKKMSKFGVEALVMKDEVSDAFITEHTTLEDIILFLVKGERL